MNKFFKLIAIMVTMAGTSFAARAQYYEISNQLSQLISPALSGSMNYKGYVEASGLAGFGPSRANFLGVSTSQGFNYADWFFMGVGIGVDVVMSDAPDLENFDGNMSTTKAMIPVFSDFRFNIGDMSSTGFYIDIKLGASWLIGSSYLQMQEAYMSTATQFYLRPSIGIRIPVNKNKSKQAFNIGATYQFLTSNIDYYWSDDNSASLNNLGITLGYEW